MVNLYLFIYYRIIISESEGFNVNNLNEAKRLGVD